MSAQSESALSSDRPFPGLRPFAFENRDFFFGRETQTYALYRLIVQSRFVAVVGSSGSGKSSLVRAGLLPLLADESDDPGGRKWMLKEMRPGGAPLSRLADTLAELSQDEDPAIAATRRERIEFDLRSSFGIAKVLDKIEGLGGATLLLVVDQFEELFRYAGSGASGTEGDLRDAMRSRDEAADFVKLLLEASRSPSHHVRVLLTMRSDFIGECARFQGLPEAVSATQFLVPSLTRDQREEIIRDPIEKAGGTIDPTLVQRLLNDSSDDLDQLPVLQHCLLRLWERAGAAGSIGPPEDTAATSRGTNAPAQTAAGGRHLTLEHYEGIGRISGALSQHAEEILTNLVGLEHVVERVFRTLAEIDKEGRAIRRALPFDQLCGETGEPEPDVRRVVDRFRADDCSFLVPSLSSAPRLEPDTRIDVGHEALLRRWERARGWLQAEARDGEQYRRLLSRAENEKDALPPKAVKETSKWWSVQPRTARWAERYGGGLDRVDRLIKDSIARRRRIIRTAVAAACLAVVAVEVSGLMYMNYRNRMEKFELEQEIGRRETERQTAIAKQNFQSAVGSAQRVVDQVGTSLDYGAISVKGARDVLARVKDNLQQVTLMGHTPETAEAWVNLELTISDIDATLGDLPQAYQTAKDAKDFTLRLSEAEPTDEKILRLLYAASWRMGDALADQGNDPAMVLQALREYEDAMRLTQRLAATVSDDNARKRERMFIHQKIGDIRQQQRNWDGAIEEYRAALGLIESVVDKEPENTDRQRDLANTLSRLGQALTNKRDFEAALKDYRDSYEIRSKLAAKDRDDAVLQSNLATSHYEFGKLYERRGDLDAALTEYKTALEQRERLSRKDPDNAGWQVPLATLYAALADVLRRKGDLPGALDQHTKAFQIRQQLAIRDSANPQRRQGVAIAMTAVADLRVAVGQPKEALPVYSEVLDILEELASDERNASNLDWQRTLISTYIKFGDVLAKTGDQTQALEQYKNALTRVEKLTATDPGNAGLAAQRESTKSKIQQLAKQP
jgi:tetratricopeptide (TPR) repeat protein